MPERELIRSRNSKRYIRRDARGRFTSDQVSVSRSLSADARQHAKTAAKKGYGDRGDRQTAAAGHR
jgi:hypothetical protein